MTELTNPTYGPYKVTKVLGMSNISTVYQATQQDTGKEVALRVLSPAQNSAQVERFKEELNLIAALENPYLVPIQDYGVQGDVVFLAMPLLTGGTLRERLQKQKAGERPLPSLGEVSWLLEKMAYALDYIHGEGIIHHQVETRNIMFDGENNPYLSDIGVPKLFKVAFSLKATNSISSHKYSPPEQWLSETITAASDQYVLGAIIYRLVTGRDLFESNSIAGLMNKHLNDMFTPPHYLRIGAPSDLTLVFARALAKKPDQRFPTVTTFAGEFAYVIRGKEGEPTGFFKA